MKRWHWLLLYCISLSLGASIVFPVFDRRFIVSAASATTSYTNYNSQSGYLQYAGNYAWATAHDAATCLATYNTKVQGEAYKDPTWCTIKRGVVFFDTSGIDDDATITGASLAFTTGTVANAPKVMFYADSTFTRPGTSRDTGDYRLTYYNTNAGISSTLSSSTAYNVTMTNVTSVINKAGITGFIICEYAHDYLNSVPPAATDYNTGDIAHASVKLWVTYETADPDAPVLSDETPVDTSTGISLNPDLYITAELQTGDPMNIYWRTNATGVWGDIGSEEGAANGTYFKTNSSMDEYNTKYWWSINCSDAEATVWTNETYSFTTRLDTVTNSNPIPANVATDISINPTLIITVSDTIGHLMNVTFRTNSSGSWETIDWNASSANGTYRQPSSSMSSFNTKYWWSINTTCSNGAWDNDTYYFTTSSGVPTAAIYSGAYNTTDSSVTITATGGENADNVTLYYRYSANNHSDWIPGMDYADLSLADKFDQSDDATMNYPQRIWYDDVNQLVYVAEYETDSLFVFNVTQGWNIQKDFEVLDSTYLMYFHDLWLVNNWTYNGRDYGNILFTLGGNGNHYFSAYRVNLTVTPTRISSFNLQSGGSYTNLGYMGVFKRGDCLFAAVTRLDGKMNILNVTDPASIANVSYVKGTDISAGLTNWWVPTFDKNFEYIWVNGQGTNKTTTTFDIGTTIADLSSMVYAGYQMPLNPGTQSYLFRTLQGDNKDVMIVINASKLDPVNCKNSPIDIIDVSDPTSWSIIGTSGAVDSNSTGEGRADYWGDYLTSRQYIFGGLQDGINIWNVRNASNIFKAGYFGDASYTTHSHMQWPDSNNSRIFVLSYADHSFYILNWTVNLSQSSSWKEYGEDASSPWSWNFNFPEGIGYYELCSVGRNDPITEGWASADCIVQKSPTSARTNTQVFNRYFVCGNETERSNTQIFDRYFLCGNDSSRVNIQIFNQYLLCGNNSARINTQVFNLWLLCSNDSIRTNTQVFDRYLQCGNESERRSVQVFNRYLFCGNETKRTNTQVFNRWILCDNSSTRMNIQVFKKYLLCGNESLRTNAQVFNRWLLCGNISERSITQIFNHYLLCGNDSSRLNTQVFNHYLICGNDSSRENTQIFNRHLLCGNTSERSKIQVFNRYFLCGNDSGRVNIQVFNCYLLCGNISIRTNTQIFNRYLLCGNTSARQNNQVFQRWFLCSNESIRENTQAFNRYLLCGNSTERLNAQIFDKYILCGNNSGRMNAQIFILWLLCGNNSVRSNTEIFNRYLICGNDTNRQNAQVFDAWLLCGNESIRTTTQIFNKYFLCGNDSARNAVQIFNRYLLCGNSTQRETLQIFNRWLLCGNDSARINTQVFNKYLLCGNISERVAIQVLNRWFFCGNDTELINTQIFSSWFLCSNLTSRENTQVLSKWLLCGNDFERVNTEIFSVYLLCGNGSFRMNTQALNRWLLCSNSELRVNTQAFNKWLLCGNGTNRINLQIFSLWLYCGNTSTPVPPVTPPGGGGGAGDIFGILNLTLKNGNANIKLYQNNILIYALKNLPMNMPYQWKYLLPGVYTIAVEDLLTNKELKRQNVTISIGQTTHSTIDLKEGELPLQLIVLAVIIIAIIIYGAFKMNKKIKTKGYKIRIVKRRRR